MDGWTNGHADKRVDGLTDRPIDRQCFSFIQKQKTHLRTDQGTDILSYRDKIAASKNLAEKALYVVYVL